MAVSNFRLLGTGYSRCNPVQRGAIQGSYKLLNKLCCFTLHGNNQVSVDIQSDGWPGMNKQSGYNNDWDSMV